MSVDPAIRSLAIKNKVFFDGLKAKFPTLENKDKVLFLL
jgi:hypothetical protein